MCNPKGSSNEGRDAWPCYRGDAPLLFKKLCTHDKRHVSLVFIGRKAFTLLKRQFIQAIDILYPIQTFVGVYGGEGLTPLFAILLWLREGGYRQKREHHAPCTLALPQLPNL